MNRILKRSHTRIFFLISLFQCLFLLVCLAKSDKSDKSDKGDKSGNTSVIGDSLALPENPARYYFSGDLDLSGDLTVVGPVEIVVDGDLNIGNNDFNVDTMGSVTLYVAGDIKISGNGGFNNTNVPSKLTIFGTSTTSQSFSISGNGFLSAVVYAPNADVTSNGGGNSGALLGAIVANSITFNGSPGPFHFDESLLGQNLFDLPFTINSYEFVRNKNKHLNDDDSEPTYIEFISSFFD